MEIVTVNDKQFELFIEEQQLMDEIKRVATEINRDYKGKQPLFIAVLNGSFMFASDLMKQITLPASISFVKLSSYQGSDTTGTVKEVIGLAEDIEGRDVIVVEDIVDTGYTMQDILSQLKSKRPASVAVCTLLFKPEKLRVDIKLNYVAMNIPNGFIVGYGLDYDGYGRNLRNIYKIVE